MTRSCDGCTKCCEGYLSGTAEGKPFYPGNPCHFVQIGKGCSIYNKRPKDPCVNYLCLWRSSEDIPMWMKPSEINAILDKRVTSGGIPYLYLHEAGAKLDSKVLTWVVLHGLQTGQNVLWELDGGKHYIGSSDFINELNTPQAAKEQ